MTNTVSNAGITSCAVCRLGILMRSVPFGDRVRPTHGEALDHSVHEDHLQRFVLSFRALGLKLLRLPLALEDKRVLRSGIPGHRHLDNHLITL